MERIDIVASLDKKFVMPTGVMIYSACANNPNTKIVFHLIVDKSVTEKDKNNLMKSVIDHGEKQVIIYDIDGNGFKHFKLKAKKNQLITLAAYYRLNMADILPHSLHKALYLDGDIIVRHSLLQLWQIDIDGIPLAAIPAHLSCQENLYKRLGYPYKYGYFNSGVMLINLDYWREHKVIKMFADYLLTVKEKLIYPDQDILNAVFYDKKRLLPVKYNLSSGFLHPWVKLHDGINREDFEEAKKDPVIIHYTLGKPWLRWDNHPDIHPYASTFFKYQQQTCWKDWPIEDRRPLDMRIRHFTANLLRKLKLKLPAAHNYISLPPID